MQDTLRWTEQGVTFADGSRLTEWTRIHEGDEWHWQYDTHELTFDVYYHRGQFWKLYRARFVAEGATEYSYSFGGQACRVALVRYKRTSRSPHSSRLMLVGSEEWVRTYEVEPDVHEVIRVGGTSSS